MEALLCILLFGPFVILAWAGVVMLIYTIWKEINDAYK